MAFEKKVEKVAEKVSVSTLTEKEAALRNAPKQPDAVKLGKVLKGDTVVSGLVINGS